MFYFIPAWIVGFSCLSVVSIWLLMKIMKLYARTETPTTAETELTGTVPLTTGPTSSSVPVGHIEHPRHVVMVDVDEDGDVIMVDAEGAIDSDQRLFRWYGQKAL